MSERRTAPAPIFEARDLYKSFGALRATNGLSISVGVGEVHSLIGPNGAGKTTALNQLSGELAPDAGTILFRGRDITRLSMAERAQLGIARSFQITAVFPDFSVRDNVMMAVQGRARHHFSFLRRAARDPDLTIPADRTLDRVGLLPLAERQAASLAHGQKRQLELAMALAMEPTVLLLDEPMAGMGPAESEAMAGIIEQLRADHAVLLVEHDMNVVFRVSDRLSVLVNGAVVASGEPAAVRDDPTVQAAYLRESA